MVSAPINDISLPLGFLTTVQVEPVGRWFLSQWERLHTPRGISGTREESSSESSSEVEDEEIVFEDDITYLRSLNPKEWQEQDHYKVLGISFLRSKATEDVIRKAYRYKVLRHHPDKRRASGEEIRANDDYFTCITKAFDILGDPIKRRGFDSVDPTNDDDIPEWNKKSKIEDFYKTFGPVFDDNAKWSTSKKPVPKLGENDSSREQIEKFYKFWYDFDSWREFSYLDEEDKERGSDRDERRWIEKNNKVQRAEKKKEEMKRIRKLVDTAYNNDPRVLRFKEEDKAEKLAKKKAKQDAIQAKKEEEERIRREALEKERIEAERIEAEAKAKADFAKKEKETLKRAFKKERKTLRNFCKDNNFFSNGNEDLKLFHMTELDKLCEILPLLELENLNVKLEQESDMDKGIVFKDKIASLNQQLENEKLQMMKQVSSGKFNEKSTSISTVVASEWSKEELALLIKAVNLFPAGTNTRWEVIANFLHSHSSASESLRSPKEILSKAKELQQGNCIIANSLKEDINKNAYENLEKNKKRDIKVSMEEASTRTESAAEALGLNTAPWSPEEQKLLEQALKTHSSALGSERWDRISACIPNRSKKDILKRYKELAELVRAKKAAIASSQKK